jgi:hypothetical protein
VRPEGNNRGWPFIAVRIIDPGHLDDLIALHTDGVAHVPAKWNPVRRQGHAPTLESTALPAILDHCVIPYDRKAL